LQGDGVAIGDSVLYGDATVLAQAAMINGDNTACMK
jgi:hypothetical protein